MNCSVDNNCPNKKHQTKICGMNKLMEKIKPMLTGGYTVYLTEDDRMLIVDALINYGDTHYFYLSCKCCKCTWNSKRNGDEEL